MSYKKFKIKKNMWSLKGNYHVVNEQDVEILHAEGKPLSLRKKYIVKNVEGEELFYIRQKLLTFQPTFFISKNGKDLFKIVKSFSFKPEIFVESLEDPDAFYVEGNFWGFEFKFFQDGREFAYVSKDIWKMTDTYGVAIEDGKDDQLILTVVIIINIIKDLESSG